MRRKQRGVIGLDLSITAPAGCFIPPGWRLGVWEDLNMWRMDPVPPASDDFEALYERLDSITRGVVRFVTQHAPSLVRVENYAFSKRSSSVTKLAELGGAVRVALFNHSYVAVPVPVSQARKLLLGKLPQKDAKLAVQRALYQHGATFKDDNETDAFTISNFALSETGAPCMMLHE